MQFKQKSPCNHCPFRVDQPGYLGAKRAEQIIQDLLADDFAWFGCHQSTENNEEGERICTNSTSVCAGSIILFQKIQQLPVVVRIAIATSIISLDSFVKYHSKVADTPAQFIEHHRL